MRGKDSPEFLSMREENFRAVTLRIFKTPPDLYPPLGGISLGEREGQNAKPPKTRKAKPAGGLRCLLCPKSCDHSRGVM